MCSVNKKVKTVVEYAAGFVGIALMATVIGLLLSNLAIGMFVFIFGEFGLLLVAAWVE